MATAPPPQRQSILDARSTTGLTLLDLWEMTPDEIEAHLRATAPQPEPAILRPAVPEAQSAGLIGAELRPMNQPRDVLGEAMAEGSPPVPWVAGYAMLAGRPKDEALMWDTAAGHLGQAMTAHVAMPYHGIEQTVAGTTPMLRRRTIPAPEGAPLAPRVRSSRPPSDWHFSGEGEPAIPAGMVRIYNGGGTNWFTDSREVAEHFANESAIASKKGSIRYLDLSPQQLKNYQDAADATGASIPAESALLVPGDIASRATTLFQWKEGRQPRRSVVDPAAAEAELVGENPGETLGKRKGAEAVGPTLRSLLVPAEGEAVGAPIYSQARKIVEDPRTQATQTGEAWLRFLSDPKRGVKAEEFQYTGLGDLLKGKAGQRVTREEILGHLDANQIEVKEVTKGAPHEVTWEPDADYPDEVFHGRAPDAKKPRYVVMKERSGPRAGKWIMEDSVSPSRVTGTFDTQEAAQRAATYALGLERSGQPKFSQYALPGAENYREVLLTLPVSAAKELPPGYRAQQIEAGPQSGMWEVITPTGHRTGFAARTREEAIADASVGTTTQLSLERSDTFRSGHWDEPNVLAHLRLSDRTDADGKRVLLVEELQSDWGQKGRREGFKGGPVDTKGWQANLKEGKSPITGNPVYVVVDAEGNQIGAPTHSATSPEQAIEIAAKGVDRGKHPEAPFVTDTAKWTTLGLKRVLKMAADEGYDRVGIVRGEEQAQRYDLSKQMDELKWYKDGDKYRVTAMKNGSAVIQKGGLTNNELAETVGKEMADKIVAGAGQEQNGSFSGLDLKVGGEGMKGYYDKIVPETLNKLAKEYGVKVKLEGGKVKTPGAETPIHTLDVPEEMRKQIKAKGLPLYSRQNNLAFLLRNA